MWSGSNIGANIAHPNLCRTVMPLVKVLRDASLSWSNREEIADAILATWRAHKSMQDEAHRHAQAACAGQERQGLG